MPLKSTQTALFRSKVPALMRRFMLDFSCSREDGAAVFGNAGHECNGFQSLQEIKPTVVGSRGGYGWFQWTGPRRKAFEAYCSRNDLKPSSEEANYKFLWVELHGDEAKAIPALKRAQSLKDKVIAFEMAFERAGVKHYPSRLEWAQVALAAFDADERKPAPSIPKPDPEKPEASLWDRIAFWR